MSAQDAATWLNDAYDMLQGQGAHADHEQQQIGRCVYCSCGQRIQGQMPQRMIARRFSWRVVAPDGFVLAITDSEQRAGAAG